MVDSVQRLENLVKQHPETFNSSSISSFEIFIRGVSETCKKLESVLDKYLPGKDDSNWDRIKKAVGNIGQDKDVGTLAQKLKDDILHLTLFQVSPTNAVTKDGASHLDGKNVWNVPTRFVHTFIGRNDILTSISSALERHSSRACNVVVLQGMGGQGKTQTALEYCRKARLTGTYAAIGWIDASSKGSTERDFGAVADLLKEPHQTFAETEARIAYAKSFLSTWSRKWLLVFDNYDNPSEFNVAEFFPANFNGHILVTSRSQDTYRLGEFISVKGMTERDAVSLLYDRARLEENEENHDDVCKIVKRLGYLPLAVDQAGAYLGERKGILRVQDFLSHYEHNMTDVLTTTPKIWEYIGRVEPGQQTEGVKNVFTAWNMSLLLLEPQTTFGRRAIEFLNLLTFFNENDISEELFMNYCKIFRFDQDRPPWILEFTDNSGNWDKKRFSDVVLRFRSLSLVASAEEKSGFVHISIHPLVKDWIRLRQDHDVLIRNYRQASQILATSLSKHMQFFRGTQYGFPMTESTRATFLAHVTVWETSFELHGDVGPITMHFDNVGANLPDVAAEMYFIWFLGSSLQFQRVLNVAQRLWSLCGDSNICLRQTKFFAGLVIILVYQDLLDDSRKQEEIRRQIRHWTTFLDRNDPILEQLKHMLVTSLDDSHENPTGSAADEREKICRELVMRKDDSDEYLIYYAELGCALLDSNSAAKQHEGREVLEELLRVDDIRQLPPDTRILSMFTSHRTYPDHWDRFSLRLLEILRKRYGEQHINTVEEIQMRARVLCRLGAVDDAESLLSPYVNHALTSTSTRDVQVNICTTMGEIARSQGKLEKAIEFYSEGLKRMPNLSPTHLQIGILWTLSDCCQRVGRMDVAVNLLFHRWNICRELRDDSESMDTMMKIEDYLATKGQEGHATRSSILEEALNMCKAKSERDSNMSSIAFTGQLVEGTKHDYRSLEILKEKIGWWYGFEVLLKRARLSLARGDLQFADTDIETVMANLRQVPALDEDSIRHTMRSMVGLISQSVDIPDEPPMNYRLKYAHLVRQYIQQYFSNDEEFKGEIEMELEACLKKPKARQPFTLSEKFGELTLKVRDKVSSSQGPDNLRTLPLSEPSTRPRRTLRLLNSGKSIMRLKFKRTA